jgi:hypothetical protein
MLLAAPLAESCPHPAIGESPPLNDATANAATLGTTTTWHHISTPSISLAPKSESEVDLWSFSTIATSSTPLAPKSEPEVDIFGVSMPFPPPVACKCQR